VAQIQIADAHLPDLERLSREYNIELGKLISLIIAVGIETLEAVDFDIDAPIGYELTAEEES
jgi:hypothetical protein